MIITAPEPLNIPNDAMKTNIFLAGSIEMGDALPWQDDVARIYSSSGHYNVFNPRRANWNASWKQSIENAEFYR
jgi:hypothetical protein